MHFWPAKLNKHTNKRKSPEMDITTGTALCVGGFSAPWWRFVVPQSGNTEGGLSWTHPRTGLKCTSRI